MAVFETYSSRVQRAAKAGQHDVFTYEQAPPFLRTQLVQIFIACIGQCGGYSEPDPWQQIAGLLDREVESFHDFARHDTALNRCANYVLRQGNINDLLSLVEVCCRWMMVRVKRPLPDHEREGMRIEQDPADGLAEVNERFRNAGVGFQYEVNANEIMRVDSQYAHAEIVKPALELLSIPEFDEANREFRLAHEHYRAGNYRDSNTAALRSVEALLKSICDARNWTHDPGAPVERLIAVVRSNGLFPEYLGGAFDNFIGAMKAGLPKIRDKDGGHGAAPGQPPVPQYLAGYALHLAASNTLMLAEAHRALPLTRP